MLLWFLGREVGEVVRKILGRKRKGVCKILKRKRLLNLVVGGV